MPQLSMYLLTELNHELIFKGSLSLESPVKITGAGHLGRLLPSGGADILGSGGGLGLGLGLGLGDGLGSRLTDSSSWNNCSWAAVSWNSSGSAWAGCSWWAVSSSLSWSSSDDEAAELDSSWAGSRFSWCVSVAGAWDSGFCWLELGIVLDWLLVKRPLLSLGCEILNNLGEQISPGDAQGLQGNKVGYRYARCWGAEGDQSSARDQRCT